MASLDDAFRDTAFHPCVCSLHPTLRKLVLGRQGLADLNRRERARLCICGRHRPRKTLRNEGGSARGGGSARRPRMRRCPTQHNETRRVTRVESLLKPPGCVRGDSAPRHEIRLYHYILYCYYTTLLCFYHTHPDARSCLVSRLYMDSAVPAPISDPTSQASAILHTLYYYSILDTRYSILDTLYSVPLHHQQQQNDLRSHVAGQQMGDGPSSLHSPRESRPPSSTLPPPHSTLPPPTTTKQKDLCHRVAGQRVGDGPALPTSPHEGRASSPARSERSV